MHFKFDKFEDLKIEENPDSPKTDKKLDTHSKNTDMVTPKRVKQLREECPGAPARGKAKVLPTANGKAFRSCRNGPLVPRKTRFGPRGSDYLKKRLRRQNHDLKAAILRGLTVRRLNGRQCPPASPVRRTRSAEPEQLPNRNRERSISLDNVPN
jgi:hypothetical protein